MHGLYQEHGLERLQWVSNRSARPSASAHVVDMSLSLARTRVRQMAFVGMTEAWDLSVCLFHAMFGGECLAVEFNNSRPSSELGTRPDGINSTEPQKITQKHVFWGLNKNTELFFTIYRKGQAE